jgi:hypothetical protein
MPGLGFDDIGIGAGPGDRLFQSLLGEAGVSPQYMFGPTQLAQSFGIQELPGLSTRGLEGFGSTGTPGFGLGGGPAGPALGNSAQLLGFGDALPNDLLFSSTFR